jgi:hypothetical protein
MLSREEIRHQLQAVEDLEEPIKVVLGQISDDVRNDRIALMIGDDTSARLPARMFRQIINDYRTKNGMARLPLVFVPGGGMGRDATWPQARKIASREALQMHAEKLSQIPDDQYVLLVTDWIRTGDTVTLFAQELWKMGVKMKVATISASAAIGTSFWCGSPEHGYKVEITSGGVGKPAVDGAWRVSGVSKSAVPRLGHGSVSVNKDPAARVVSRQARLAGNQIAAQLSL